LKNCCADCLDEQAKPAQDGASNSISAIFGNMAILAIL